MSVEHAALTALESQRLEAAITAALFNGDPAIAGIVCSRLPAARSTFELVGADSKRRQHALRMLVTVLSASATSRRSGIITAVPASHVRARDVG